MKACCCCGTARASPSSRPQIRSYFLSSPPVIVAKGNGISTVHRRGHWDIIGIKLYGKGGKIAGQFRIAGLFAASAYNLSVLNIPLLRHKAAAVLQGAGYPAGGHSERALLNALETFPRDELFQIPVEQLARIAGEIVKTDLTPRPRVFIRRDEFERFVSAFVYVPRERYNTEVRLAIVKALEEAFGGRLESFTPFFPEGAMVRIHFVIWRTNGALKEAAEESLERAGRKDRPHLGRRALRAHPHAIWQRGLQARGKISARLPGRLSGDQPAQPRSWKTFAAWKSSGPASRRKSTSTGKTPRTETRCAPRCCRWTGR